jgi:hypothetical protein
MSRDRLGTLSSHVREIDVREARMGSAASGFVSWPLASSATTLVPRIAGAGCSLGLA